MSWSGLQRETLEAMGFALLVPRTGDSSVPHGSAAESGAPGIATGADARATAAQRPLPARPAAAAPSSAAAAAPARRAEPGPAPALDRLARALLRAAGRAPDAADASTLLAQWPDPARLRRDHAAKRALWPRLRALRRTDA